MTQSYPPQPAPRYQLQYTDAGLDGTRAWALFTVPSGGGEPQLLTAQEQPGHSAHQVSAAQQWAAGEVGQRLGDEGLPYEVADAFKEWVQISEGVYAPYLNHVIWTARLVTAAGVFTFPKLTFGEVSRIKMAVLHGDGRIELDQQRLEVTKALDAMKDTGVDDMFLLARHVIAETYKRVTVLINPYGQ